MCNDTEPKGTLIVLKLAHKLVHALMVREVDIVDREPIGPTKILLVTEPVVLMEQPSTISLISAKICNTNSVQLIPTTMEIPLGIVINVTTTWDQST